MPNMKQMELENTAIEMGLMSKKRRTIKRTKCHDCQRNLICTKSGIVFLCDKCRERLAKL